MSIQLHAQPYDIAASGFYFTTIEEYQSKAKNNRNDFGDHVEEYEIQFIDGEAIDCELAKVISLSQANFADFLTCVEDWQYWEKINTIIAIGEGGYDFDAQNDPDHYGIDVYYVVTMRELAEQLVDEGLFGDIPEHLVNYIDYDAIARDLEHDYSIIEIAGETLAYRMD